MCDLPAAIQSHARAAPEQRVVGLSALEEGRRLHEIRPRQRAHAGRAFELQEVRRQAEDIHCNHRQSFKQTFKHTSRRLIGRPSMIAKGT